MHKSEREGTTPSSAIANILRTSYILARVSETAIIQGEHQLIEEEKVEGGGGGHHRTRTSRGERKR